MSEGVQRSRQRRFTAFERLTPEGKAVVLHGFREGWTQDKIQVDLAKQTQESISNGALGRLIKYWRLQQDQEEKAAENAERMVRALKRNDLEASEFATSLIQLGLLANQEEIEGVGPQTLLKLQRDFLELSIKQQELELKSRRVETAERELELKEKQLEIQTRKLERIAKEAEALQQAAEADGGVSDEFKRKLRNVYGLATKEAA